MSRSAKPSDGYASRSAGGSISVACSRNSFSLPRSEEVAFINLENWILASLRQQDRAFIYWPAHPKNQVIGGLIREFIDRVFNGSAEPLLVHLVKSRRIREKDLQKIVRMIEEAK